MSPRRREKDMDDREVSPAVVDVVLAGSILGHNPHIDIGHGPWLMVGHYRERKRSLQKAGRGRLDGFYPLRILPLSPAICQWGHLRKSGWHVRRGSEEPSFPSHLEQSNSDQATASLIEGDTAISI